MKFNELNENDLQFVHQLAKDMAQALDETQILNILLNKLIERTGAEVGAFIYYNNIADNFETKTIKTNVDKSKNVQPSKTVLRNIQQKKEALLTFDTASDDAIAGTKSIVINKIHAILAFPLEVKNELYGIMYFDSRENRQSFTEESRQLLSFFAPIASLILEQLISKHQIDSENTLLKSRLENVEKLPEIIGESEEMKKVFRMVHKVASSDVSVLIQGENGTGKDLLARAIHDLSTRKEYPFIAQFVGNIPSSILDSELFGYKKGAFTGANNDKMGLFEAVDNGTLFLDEIGELTLDLQTKLLRVLQNGEIKRVGENVIRKVSVRIIAATNRNLKSLIKDGQFREDLYYRLNVIAINVPPLRDRRNDIPLLVNHFLQNENEKNQITSSAVKKLMNFHWPGNVRQLENVIKRAQLLATNSQIDSDDIVFDDMEDVFSGSLEDYKNILIKQRLIQFNGNKTLAAKSLNISLRSLQLKVKELGI